MSNSLTINTPNIVQQNTPLRNVPSGSTAEPDYNVKYVQQSLTEEQKAQARLNIGAAAEGQGGGGNSADLDKYWIVYPEGNTTISLHAGTINKVWMDGEEVEAVSDVYSVNAFSVVRIDATDNASFIFGNTTDPIWLWSPAGVTVDEPVYGTHYNVNLVNRNGGGSNLNFSGKVWLMNNKITPSMFDMTTETRVTKSPRIYLNDTPVDLSALTEEPNLTNCPTLFYIPQKRFEEFKAAIYTKFGNTFFNNMKCHWVVYEQLVQEDFKFRFILYSDPSEAYCYLKIYQDSSNSIKYTNRWAQRHCVGVYRDGLFEDPEHLMSIRATEGENRTASVDNTVNLTFGENLLIFNRYDSTEVFVVNDTEWNNYTIPTWMYVKNFEGNPLVSDWTPDKLNVVYENGATKLQSFGHNGGGTSYIYLNNNTISDGRMYLVNNNVVVFTNQSMSGVSKGSQTGHWQWGITQASDVKATIYCPRSRYDELVARYETLYADEIAGGTFQISWITDHIVKYDYIEDVDYRKNIVIMEQVQSDWNQSDTTAPDYIKNKPTIPSGGVDMNPQTENFKSWLDIYINQNIDVKMYRNDGWGSADGQYSGKFPLSYKVNGVEHKYDYVEFGRRLGTDDGEYDRWITFSLKSGKNLLGYGQQINSDQLSPIDGSDVLSNCEIWIYAKTSFAGLTRNFWSNAASINIVRPAISDTNFYLEEANSLGYQDTSNTWIWTFLEGNGTPGDGENFYEFSGNYVYGSSSFSNVPATSQSSVNCKFYVKQSAYNNFLTTMASKAPNISQADIIAATTQYDHIEPYDTYKWRMVMPV